MGLELRFFTSNCFEVMDFMFVGWCSGFGPSDLVSISALVDYASGFRFSFKQSMYLSVLC